MTGHLGEVMQESMTAALTWTRANGERYGIDPDFFRKQDIHITCHRARCRRTARPRVRRW